MADVFVSYKAEDRARVKPLVDGLLAAGLTVWWDAQIAAGEAWRARIARELDSAACVVVVWSEGSVGGAGHFVQDEASQALRRGVLLPVAIDTVDPPLGFGQHQALSLAGWRGSPGDPRFEDVLAATQAIIGGGPRPPPRARAAGARPIRRARIVGGIVAGIAVVIAVGAAIGLLLTGGPGRLFAAPPKNSVAVLPFENLSGDAAQAYFSDGLTDEITGTLARIKGLQVTGRTSAFQFRGGRMSPKEIGAKLGVAWLLDGSVRREGGLVRVSASLADAATGLERWSQTYERDTKDILAVQSGIAQAVAESLRVKLLGGDIAALSRGDTLSPEAFDAYLRGQQLVVQSASEVDLRQALADFDAAIGRDPSYAKAYASKAIGLMKLAGSYLPPSQVAEAYDQALRAARQAIAAAPGLPRAQAAYAEALVFAARDFTAAAAAFRRGLAAAPDDAGLLASYGGFQCQIGDCAAGAQTLRKSTRLDPLNPDLGVSLASVLIGARQFQAAIAALRQALILKPSMSVCHGYIGLVLILEGRPAEAIPELALEPLAWLRRTGEALARMKLGDSAGARRAAATLKENGDPNAYQLAQIHAQWGERDAAFDELNAALRSRDAGLLMLKSDPFLDPVRSDPRFPALLRRVGL